MGRRGRSTTVGKFAKIHHDRRVSEIRMLGELLRREQRAATAGDQMARQMTREDESTRRNRRALSAR